MSCDVAGCEREKSRKGWCERHYQRWKAYGDPLVVTQRIRSADLVAEFWREITEHGTEPRVDCLEWPRPAARNRKGYGITTRGSERIVSRAVWTEVYGPIPDGQMVLHECDNPPCGWPAHLFLGTAADNSADMVEKGRSPRRFGVANRRTRFPDELIRSLRLRASQGESYAALAREIGAHPAYVALVCQGKRRRAA